MRLLRFIGTPSGYSPKCGPQGERSPAHTEQTASSKHGEAKTLTASPPSYVLRAVDDPEHTKPRDLRKIHKPRSGRLLKAPEQALARHIQCTLIEQTLNVGMDIPTVGSFHHKVTLELAPRFCQHAFLRAGSGVNRNRYMRLCLHTFSYVILDALASRSVPLTKAFYTGPPSVSLPRRYRFSVVWQGCRERF